MASQVAWILLFLSTGVSVAWFQTRHLDEIAAIYGFSPSALFASVWERPSFAMDFPNGEATMLTSLVGQIYHALGTLPFPRQVLAGVVVWAEFVTLGIGAFACARAANSKLPIWTAVVAALLLSSGGLVNCNLARWFHPYFGSTYNFVYGVGLAAIAAILWRKPVWAGLFIGIAVAIHPINGLLFGLAVVVIAFIDFQRFSLSRLILGGMVAFVLAGCWIWMMLGGAGVSGRAVDPALYISLTRLMSSHWFPISIGVFSVRAFEALIPFVGFMTVVVAVLRPLRSDLNNSDYQIGAAILILLVVTAIGVFASEYSGSPLLVKLALHRASVIVLLLGAIIIVPRLVIDITSGSILRSLLAGALLLLAYWRDYGPPILLCVLFAGVVLFEERRRRSRAELILLMTAIAAAIGVVGIFAGTTAMPYVFGNANLGVSALRDPFFLFALLLTAISRLVRVPIALAVGMAAGVFVWVPHVDRLHDPNELQRARDFLEVQLWARANTPKDALFMIDPTFTYGWREMSERPSFGTVREWLYSGWIYDTKATVFNEGLRRAHWLGLHLDRYLKMNNVAVAYSEMWQEAKGNYNSMDAQQLQAAADKYKISFFVFDKRNAVRLPELPIAFANGRYAILAAAR